MVHGAEAVLPMEVQFKATRVEAYSEEDSNMALIEANDLVDEARDVALARTTIYQQNLQNYHSRRVRPRSFSKGDLVLRLKQKGHLKLEPPWEGPYLVTEVLPGGEYRLQEVATGVKYSNPWNVAHLRRFYP